MFKEGLTGKALAIGGVASGVGGIGAGVAAGFPAEKMLELGLGGAGLLATIFVVQKFLQHIRSEGAANRQALTALGEGFQRFGDKLDRHLELMGQQPRRGRPRKEAKAPSQAALGAE